MSGGDQMRELALAAGRGDREAFGALIRATQSDVWRLCAHLLDRQSADDLTQETYLRAADGLRTFRAEAPVRHWLFTIARRVCIHEIDRRARTSRLQARLTAEPFGGVPDHAHEVELHMLLDRLDANQRTAFVLTQLLGCSYAETAAICECPIGTVRSRVARARDELVAAASGGQQRRWPAS